MNRTLFIVLFHVSAAGLVTLAVLLYADLTGWQGPRWLPIGVVALLAAGPVNHWVSAAHSRWFR